MNRLLSNSTLRRTLITFILFTASTPLAIAVENAKPLKNAATLKKPAAPSSSHSDLGVETPSSEEKTIEQDLKSAKTRPEPRKITEEETDYPRKARDDRYGKTEGVLGPVTFGPSLTLLAVTRPVALGLESKYLDIAGLAAFYGYLPEIKIKDVKVKYSSWDVRARWYVFQGAFFLGGAIGKQNLKASKTDTIASTAVNAEVEMSTLFFTPHVGWQWIWDSGFFMGMDVGVQLPMSRKTTITTNASPAIQAQTTYTDLTNKVTDSADKIGKIVLPMITFIKVGWLF